MQKGLPFKRIEGDGMKHFIYRLDIEYSEILIELINVIADCLKEDDILCFSFPSFFDLNDWHRMSLIVCIEHIRFYSRTKNLKYEIVLEV